MFTARLLTRWLPASLAQPHLPQALLAWPRSRRAVARLAPRRVQIDSVPRSEAFAEDLLDLPPTSARR